MIGEHEIKDGMVLVPEMEYQAIMEALEMSRDVDAYDKALREAEEFYPGDVVKALCDGENPVRVFRKYRGLTQSELAAQAGVSQSSIASIETGRKKPSVATVKAIAVALDVDVDEII